MNEPDISAEPVLQPYQLGVLQLPNRVVMSPMTRGRATNPSLIPTELDAEYYAQRASAGLIITGGTWVNRDAIGYPNVPGLFTDEQTQAWAAVTDASTRIAAAFSPKSATWARCHIVACSAADDPWAPQK